jgi:hypothetical protein
MITFEERQAAILAAGPYLPGEAVLLQAAAGEHADMGAGHAAWCAGPVAHAYGR